MKQMGKGNYEKPEIMFISVAIENGFAGSPNNPNGDFDHGDSDTEWEEED